MSFREKSSWACLVTTVAVFGPYFAYVFRLSQRGELSADAIFWEFVGAVVLQVILLVAAHILIAVRSREEQRDERDVAMESKSFRNAYSVLSVSCVLLTLCVITLALVPESWPADRLLAPAFMSQLFLLCCVLAEATKYATQAVCYRRGC